MDAEKEPIKPLFPEFLLERSADERLTYFRNRVIAHEALIEARDQLLQLLRHPATGLVVLVYGPSGVGKTTLALKVLRLLLKEGMARMEREPGHIAAGYMELVNPYRSVFDWRRYFLDLQLVYQMPPTLLERKVAYSWATSPESGALLQVRERSSIDALARAAENALIRCKPVAHLLDEGNHLLRAGAGADRIDNQMDTIKSMANRTDVPHVLFGTYKLLRFADLHGQLSRRAEQVHLRRYNIHVKADETAFLGVLNTFQRYLPLAEMPDLVGDVDLLYTGSLGCVGTLKEWLDRALKHSLYGKQKGAGTFRDHLVATALSDASLIQIMTEAKEGEEEVALMRGPDRRKEIKGLLKSAPRLCGRILVTQEPGTGNTSLMAPMGPATSLAVAESNKGAGGRDAAGAKGKGKAASNGSGKRTRGGTGKGAGRGRARRPGERLPSRDKVGIENVVGNGVESGVERDG
jgi:energy-coupling factor transporter ATP-binding protein EcfA2